MIEKQVTFDMVINRLKAQGCPAKATDKSKRCVYRNEHGHKCAAGILIPDDKYDPDFERQGSLIDVALNVLRIEHPVAHVLRGEGHDVGLVARLQHVHDYQWPTGTPFPVSAFKRLAVSEGLIYKE